MDLHTNRAIPLSLLRYLTTIVLLLGFTAYSTAQTAVDENGHQLHTVYLDEYLAGQIDASDQEPMRSADDPRNAEDWRGWHLATTRAVVEQIEAEYGIEAVGMTSHIMMTFSAYLSPEMISQLRGDQYVTEIVPAMEDDIQFSGSPMGSAASLNVTSVPEVPNAYEPFELHITTRRGDPGSLVAVNVTGNVITIEHQTDAVADFIPPGGLMKVTIPGLPAGSYTVENKEFASGGSGAGYLYVDHPVSLSIEAGPVSQPVHAFYLPSIKHYFITASEEERGKIQSYTISVDAGFNAWPADGPAPQSAQPICRFYSSLVNSHFYTADQEECEQLKQENSGWAYEGIAFQALIPAAGACPPGTYPVWRLYNNRFAQMDSNHRFVASTGIYNTMMADGWEGEGVAFCSPSSEPRE